MTDKKAIKDIIIFIRKNDPSYSNKPLENYSYLELVVLKTQIEIAIEKKKNEKP